MSKNRKTSQAARARRQKSLTFLWISLAGIVLLILAVSLGMRRGAPEAFEPEVTGSPSLRANQEKVDLGDVRLGDWVQVSFVMTNVGDQPLRFTRAPYIDVIEGC